MEYSRLADATQARRHMFVRDLILAASIGVYAHERAARQRVRINIDLAVAEAREANVSHAAVGADDLGRVVDYEAIVKRARAITASGHVQLVETLAERLAEACLADERVVLARVRVEKLDVFPDLTSVGVEVERRRG